MRIAVEGWAPARIALGDDVDATFTATFHAPCDGHLRFEGIATLATILIDGTIVATSSSMWVPLELPIGSGCHIIEVKCRALTPELQIPRKPRARWRQKVAYDNGLRWFRTSLNGRAPGFAPGPPVVGLFRPVWFISGEATIKVRSRLQGDLGIVTIETDFPDGTRVEVGDEVGKIAGGRAEIHLSSPKLWWPHSHGEAFLYDVIVDASDEVRKIGFRTLSSDGDILKDGLKPVINGVPIFVRGALWTPVQGEDVRSTLLTARDHGLNAVRLPGTMSYETKDFHDACDELGILVWQDLMFANFDYPFSDPEFHALVIEELDALFETIGGRPSTFVVCGGSEIEQQVAMLGLDPEIARPEFFKSEVPNALSNAKIDALYVPSAPCGATRPLIAHEGVSNWFGVGGYRKPLSSIRSANVRFASECLALSNIGDDAGDLNDPSWKAGIPKDEGEDWDFEDVRDHYLNMLYGVDPKYLRKADPNRWLELSKRVSGDVMSEVFGEWRRSQSECSGAFVLWLRDLKPGAGWGLLDSEGRTKQVLRDLKNVLQPVAIWMTDEEMSGYQVHVANDRADILRASVTITLTSKGRHVDTSETQIIVEPRSQWTGDVESILKRWLDVSYSYRFGPPNHDLVTAELKDDETNLLGRAHRFPLGRTAAS